MRQFSLEKFNIVKNSRAEEAKINTKEFHRTRVKKITATNSSPTSFTKEVNPSDNLDAIIIEDVFPPLLTRTSQAKSGHSVIVLVHGFQANPQDLRGIKLAIQEIFPNTQVMISIQNVHQTDGDIWKMGETLAKEIKQYLNIYCPGSIFGKLSFI